MIKGKTKDLLIGLAIILFAFVAVILWFMVQRDSAGTTFYMFSPNGHHIAFGYIEGFEGYLPFAFPPLLAIVCIVCSAMTLIKKLSKIKAWLYASCALFSLSAVLMYILTYFNAKQRFGDIEWCFSFWFALGLYCAVAMLSAYFCYNNFRNSNRVIESGQD